MENPVEKQKTNTGVGGTTGERFRWSDGEMPARFIDRSGEVSDGSAANRVRHRTHTKDTIQCATGCRDFVKTIPLRVRPDAEKQEFPLQPVPANSPGRPVENG